MSYSAIPLLGMLQKNVIIRKVALHGNALFPQCYRIGFFSLFTLFFLLTSKNPFTVWELPPSSILHPIHCPEWFLWGKSTSEDANKREGRDRTLHSLISLLLLPLN